MALLTLKTVLWFLSPFQKGVKDLSTVTSTVPASGFAKNRTMPDNCLPVWLVLTWQFPARPSSKGSDGFHVGLFFLTSVVAKSML